MNQRTENTDRLHQQLSLLRCPICQESMQIIPTSSLVCSQNHTFDMAKQGYVNLFPKTAPNKYDKQIFVARRALMKSGFFEPVLEKIITIISTHFSSSQPQVLPIVDMGCGEGTHLVQICGRLAQLGFNPNGLGIDLAKEGILEAAKQFKAEQFFVADLANSPFHDRSFAVILNILSPSNYTEFHRIMQPNGMVIKLIPQADYLKELRIEIFSETDKQLFSNVDIQTRFKENFQRAQTTRITYTKSLSPDQMQLLIQMTPLTWHVAADKLGQLQKLGQTDITVDLDVLIGFQD